MYYIPPQRTNQIFTPKETVRNIRRLYNSDGMRKAYPNDKEQLTHIIRHQVYGLAPTEIIYKIATNYILGFAGGLRLSESDHHFRMADALPAAKEGKLEGLVDKIFG